MNRDDIARRHLQVCKEHPQLLVRGPSLKSKLPSGDISVITQGDKLYLRPASPYRYTMTSEAPVNESARSDDNNDAEMQLHQRSSTTIINDIAQSYTFVPGSKKTQESSVDDVGESPDSSLSMDFHPSHSFLASTNDPQSFLKKTMVKVKRSSTLRTISSGSSEFKQPAIIKFRKPFEMYTGRDSLLEPVMAFCQQCRKNVLTEVIEKEYLGNL